ncbi:Bromodomain adjacent to zinc finger domain protein like [Actinidia chinensis var. chinensis]|uniref:Bromodomain adjacent to zinc finger domain protein like n=1 Tax=Actinidia chinensis var. chinensis TaxID=1590841 RepID=A0A2R6R4J4_ACTCC|nr:Bromodomain adjacent to zinc finger domain protein like [Actinidia chinensis var. chinensis]
MPKERRDRSVSFDRSRASPFPCSSSRSRQSLPKNPPESDENVKEWEEARCPVCMEHPHNALLLLCSSHDKGCHPYMCDTSYRHSNCFDQFCKSFDTVTPLTIENSTDGSLIAEPPVTNLQVEIRGEGSTSTHPVSCEDDVKTKLVCPLCRGHITGWIVVDSARRFMNSKSRSCASETCEFSGPYTDLRKHARSVHPCVRPSEADPERERNWRRLERQRDLGDLISTLQSSMGEERSEDSTLALDDGGWLTVFFLIRVFRPGSSLRSTSWSNTSRARAQVTVRRRSTRLWGETHDVETGSVSRDDDNESSDGESGSSRPRERIRRRQPSPDNEH